MRKKLLGLCVVLILGVLSACGKGDSAGVEPESTKTVTEETMVADTETGESNEISSSETEDSDEETDSVLTTIYRATKEVYYNADGSVSNSFINEYDQYGNMTKSEGKGEYAFTTEWKYEYDENGNILNEIAYNSEGTALRSVVYEYNSNGDIIKETVGDEDGAMSEWVN